MVAKFLDLNSRDLSNDDGDGNENGKTSNGFTLYQNNNFARASHFSVFIKNGLILY